MPHRRGRRMAGGGEYDSHAVDIGFGAATELFGVNAGGHKQTIDAEGGGALEIGVD
jgi:hypothetical protein